MEIPNSANPFVLIILIQIFFFNGPELQSKVLDLERYSCGQEWH